MSQGDGTETPVRDKLWLERSLIFRLLIFGANAPSRTDLRTLANRKITAVPRADQPEPIEAATRCVKWSRRHGTAMLFPSIWEAKIRRYAKYGNPQNHSPDST